MLQSEFLGTMYGTAGRCMPQHPNHDKPILIHVMVWCRQATIHYLSLYWPQFMMPHGVTRPQWGKNTDLHFPNGMYDMFRLVQCFIWKKSNFMYHMIKINAVVHLVQSIFILYVLWYEKCTHFQYKHIPMSSLYVDMAPAFLFLWYVDLYEEWNDLPEFIQDFMRVLLCHKWCYFWYMVVDNFHY